MPHALEFPRMLRAVVPLMRRKGLSAFCRDIVNEFVALALRHSARSCGCLAGRRTRLYPRLSAVVRSLHNLAEPAAGLRRINAVRFGGRSLHVIDLPAG